MAAMIARMATTQTISSRVKPSSPRAPSAHPADDVACRAGSTFLAIRAIRDDVVGPVLPGRAVDVGVAPRIVGDDRAPQIRAVPRHDAARALHQGGEALRARRVAPVVEEV